MPGAWLVVLLLGVSILVFVGVVADVGLRISALRVSAASDPRCGGAETAQPTQKGLYVPDSAASYVMPANACVRLRTAEHDETQRTNSHGPAGPELSTVKQPGEFRIVVLGDSCWLRRRSQSSERSTFGPSASTLVEESIAWFPRNHASPSLTQDASPRDAVLEVRSFGFPKSVAFSFFRATGHLWLGDVGEAAVEEIDHQPRGQRRS